MDSSEASLNVVSEGEKNDVEENPWPYLNKMFRFESKEGKSFKYTCLLCKPKNTVCSAYEGSSSNLKKHVERKHPTEVTKYESLTRLARKRKAESDYDSEPQRKCRQTTFPQSFDISRTVTQKAVDDSVLNLVVGGLLPLRIVELPEFVGFISVLQQNRQTITGRALRQNIDIKASQSKERLVALLKDQPFVATTADCWSVYGKSYMGVTVHWIDQTDLHRQSAVLARRRMRGSHTHEAIAAILDEIHTQYGISLKIVRATTDNGANFIKAFSVFAQSNGENIVIHLLNQINQLQHLKNLLAASSNAAMLAEQRASHSSDAGSGEDSFFNCTRTTVSHTDILMRFLQDRSDDMNVIIGSETLKKLFIQLNTPLPASAAVERLFSCAGLTMNSRRTRMSDKLFEDLVMLKINKHL